MRGTVWVESHKLEFMLHVEGVLAGIDWDKPKLFSDKAIRSGLGRGGEDGLDKRVRTTKTKVCSTREGSTRTCNPP